MAGWRIKNSGSQGPEPHAEVETKVPADSWRETPGLRREDTPSVRGAGISKPGLGVVAANRCSLKYCWTREGWKIVSYAAASESASKGVLIEAGMVSSLSWDSVALFHRWDVNLSTDARLWRGDYVVNRQDNCYYLDMWIYVDSSLTKQQLC